MIAISRSINELEEKGYVYLDTESKKGAYRTRIVLTERGREAVAYMKERVEHALDVVGSGLEETQRSTFYESLMIISERLQAYVEQ